MIRVSPPSDPLYDHKEPHNRAFLRHQEPTLRHRPFGRRPVSTGGAVTPLDSPRAGGLHFPQPEDIARQYNVRRAATKEREVCPPLVAARFAFVPTKENGAYEDQAQAVVLGQRGGAGPRIVCRQGATTRRERGATGRAHEGGPPPLLAEGARRIP